MSNARKLAANLPREGGTGNRNLIINGNFLVWQRSLNADSGGSGYVSADRWRTTRGRIRKPNTNGNTGEDERGAIFDCVDNRVYTHFDYKVEDVDNKLHGKRATLSFEAKSLTGSTFGCYMENTSATDKLDIDGGNQTIQIPTTWTKFIFTGTINSTSTAATYGVAMPRWYLNPQGVGDSSRKIQIDNVQLELGEQATPFEHKSYDEELTRCQRYFYRLQGPLHAHTGWMYSNAGFSTTYTLPTEMRATPTWSLTGTQLTGGWNEGDNISVYADGNWRGTTSITYGGTGASNNREIRVDATLNTATTSGNSAGMYMGPNAYFDIDAEV